MNDAAFLSYFPDPFNVKDSRYFVLYGSRGGNELSGGDLSNFAGTLITYETQVLIEDMRRGGVRPPLGLINIDDAIRLRAGRARDEGGERLWNLWRNLGPHFDSPGDAKVFEQVARSKSHRPDASEIVALLAKGAKAVCALWAELEHALNELDELERFLQVDVPVQQIFHHRQARGVAVDKEAALGLLRHVSTEKYLAYSKVAERLGRSPTGLGFWNIQTHLSKTDALDLAAETDGGRLRELFKMAAARSEFARDYLSYTDADRDEMVLRRSAALGGRLYPEFQAHGTVTGRILVSDPYLQQLRRRYRKIVVADHGKRLAYLDYSQFEPGILAFLSGDEALIAAYNAGDLYEALSVAVYGNADSRPLSKRIFLAYSYGMTADRVSKLLLGEGNEAKLEQMQTTISKFFEAYPGLEAFRASMQSELINKGFVGSLFGNQRRRASEGEHRQGDVTASAVTQGFGRCHRRGRVVARRRSEGVVRGNGRANAYRMIVGSHDQLSESC
ncbi:DNA polymerase [Dyella sp. 2YAF14]|uniref:DNA polymerase n=1 Tax=Dyella sp. 2YAF14 TaxID=3233025 RepID=UPI003F912F50